MGRRQLAEPRLAGREQEAQDRSLQKIDSLVKLLEQQGRKEEAERLKNSVAGSRRRDLIIKLNWQGDVDLDLHVFEPTGSMCTPLSRQTIGGGVLMGDLLADMTSETYLAAEAFSGDYEVEIERVWGHPLNNKAQAENHPPPRHAGGTGAIAHGRAEIAALRGASKSNWWMDGARRQLTCRRRARRRKRTPSRSHCPIRTRCSSNCAT